ncbi:MAG: TerB family tellurite resistance protein, partial [Desulfuromusa sp.]
MLKRLLQVFAAPTAQVDIASEERIPLAAAVLLLEVAQTDGEFHPTEQALLGTLLQEHFAVSEESLGDLLQLAEETRQSS